MCIRDRQGVDASYGPGQVLHGVNLEVDEGGMVALLGANGAGKTTTLRAICNMGVRTRGEIRFGGKRIDGRATEDIVRLGIGHVPDDVCLLYTSPSPRDRQKSRMPSSA